jgi:hypothetical protein
MLPLPGGYTETSYNVSHPFLLDRLILFVGTISREAFRGLSRGLQFGKVVDEGSSPMINLIATLEI